MADHRLRKDVGELSLAFASNDIAKMSQLTKGLPVRARDSLRSIVEVYQRRRSFGITPLISAVLHDNEHIVEMLIREQVDMGQHLGKGFQRITDLQKMEAVYMDANMQLIHGPTGDVFKDFNLTSPMFWAIKNNNLSIVEKILNCPSFEKNSLVEKINGMPALMLAVLENNIPACQVLLRCKVDLHAADFNGGRALDVAIDRKIDDMLRFLLSNGENANCKKHSQPPLIHAIDKGCTRVIEVLIQKGANLHSSLVQNTPMRPLHYAIGMQKFEAAKFLIKKGADVNAREDNGVTALQLLVRLKLEGRNVDKMAVDVLEMAKFLVAHKADVNAQNDIKETALYIAVSYMNVKLVKYLLSVNAQVSVKNHSLQTPLHAAIIPANATKAVVTVTPQTEISRHAEGGLTVNTPYIVPNQREVVKLLIKYGADIHSKDCNLHTPLFLAVGNNNLEMVELLIKMGSEVNGKNIDGTGLLHFATRENNLNIVKCLIEVGKANVNIASSNGDTPLHMAVFNKYTDIVECLIKAKAKVRVENHAHATPLGMAVAGNSSTLTKLLVKAGADVNTQHPDGSSFLHLALEFSYRKSAKSLIELGADVNIRNQNGVTPFMVAIIDLAYKGEFIQLLLDYGADPLFPCRSGLTAYQYATARHEVDILKILWRHGCPTDEPVTTTRPSDNSRKIKGTLLFRNHTNSVFSSNTPVTDKEKILRTAQSCFVEGIVENNLKKVEDGIKNGAVARGVSLSIKYPLHYAVKYGFQEVVEVLVKNGVPVNYVDDEQHTPLEIAALAGNSAICLTLLSHGACYYPGLASAICHFNAKAKQLDKESELLLNKENKLDKTNELVGNLSTNSNKPTKKSKELKKIKKDLDRRQIHTDLIRIKQEMDRYKKQHDLECKALAGDEKSMKDENQLQSLFSLMNLFIIIRRLFLLIQKGDRRRHEIAKAILEESFEKGKAPFCKSLLHSVNRKGKTLMGAAIEAGNVEMTQYLMNLRLQHSKMAASDFKD